MEHVRIRDHDLPGRADRGSDGVGSVAVVRGRVDVQPGGAAQLAQLRDLVLAQGLGGEQVQRACGGVDRESLQRWHEVAQGLARCGGRHHDDVFAGPDGFDGLRLVAVERRDAATLEAGPESGIQPLRHGDEIRRSRRDIGVVYDPVRNRRVGQEAIQNILYAGRLVVPHRAPQTERPCEICGQCISVLQA